MDRLAAWPGPEPCWDKDLQGLDNLDAILAVEGVDGAFMGPADLAATGKSTGKSAGIFVTDPALALHFGDGGASFIAVGGDTTLLRGAAVMLASNLRQDSEKPGPTS